MKRNIYCCPKRHDVSNIKIFVNLECPDHCGLVFCDKSCKKEQWHSSAECRLIKNAEELRRNNCSKLIKIHGVSSWLLVLRCLLLRENSPKCWEMVNLLEDNLEVDSYKKQHLVRYCESVLNPLKNIFPNLTSKFRDSEILHICAKLDSNSFRQGECSRALFGVASMLNHSCIPNARVLFDDAGNVNVLSKSNIEIGDEITITYCSQLLGTWVRQ
jgi:hypothetical protein